jgi:aminoglycoside 6-adenylyltransferase
MDHETMYRRFVEWGQADPRVRALILTSSLTYPGAPVDALSDYDLIVVVTGIAPWCADRGWLNDFGEVLVCYHDPLRGETGAQSFACITQYDRFKVDFTLMDVALWQRQAAERPLSPDLDLGYRVLLDKDGLTAGMPAPTHQAYIPQPPSEAQYLESIELFFHEATYAAKNIWRGDLIPARYFLDHALKMDHLIEMLSWQLEIERGWNVRLGVIGRGLYFKLSPELCAEVDKLYCGGGLATAWDDLDRIVHFFRKTARAVGVGLGYAYPERMDARALDYFAWVKSLPREVRPSS